MKLSYLTGFLLNYLTSTSTVFAYSQSQTEDCCEVYYRSSYDISSKNNQIYRLKSNLRNYQNSIQTEDYNIQVNEDEINYLADDNNHLKNSNNDMKSSISTKTAQLNKLTSYLDKYKNQYDNNREDISKLLTKIEQEKQKLNRFRSETNRQSIEIQELIKVNVDLKKKHIDRNQLILEQLKAEYQSLSPGESTENFSDASSSSSSNNNQNIDYYSSQIRYYENNIAQVQTEIDSVNQEKENCQQNQQSLNSNYNKAKKDYSDCQENLTHTKKYEDVSAAQSFLKNECKKITDKLSEENSINMNLYYSIKDKLDRGTSDRLEFC